MLIVETRRGRVFINATRVFANLPESPQGACNGSDRILRQKIGDLDLGVFFDWPVEESRKKARAME